MADTAPMSLEELRNLYSRLGVTPSDQEVEEALSVVQSLYAGARQVEELLDVADEPAVTFQLTDPPSSSAAPEVV